MVRAKTASPAPRRPRADGPSANSRPAGRPPSRAPTRPRWDGRRLWWGREVIREFGRPAPGQMAVLDEFERLGWPPRVDVKHLLPAGRAGRYWARDTARNLSHGLTGRIEFHADGTKHGIRWRRSGQAIYSKLLHGGC